MADAFGSINCLQLFRTPTAMRSGKQFIIYDKYLTLLCHKFNGFSCKCNYLKRFIFWSFEDSILKWTNNKVWSLCLNENAKTYVLHHFVSVSNWNCANISFLLSFKLKSSIHILVSLLWIWFEISMSRIDKLWFFIVTIWSRL